ncbi:amino acid permease [Gallaecimonas kandeliae]|uniref:APC family permease n=1 Tax=Gallaecimonas kandeliae TaxID=3029055 RepID=UPI002648A074|nr:amino acid permease [Gallaecimonas kandeliae]WKE64252.1 amino acid permease [Gallaecimonas kandeliae]
MAASLGFWRLWALVVGSMIGTGIFLLPSVLAPYGSLSLLGLAVSGTGTLLIALTLGSLARRIPAVGGPYAYTRSALGELPGFLVAWGYWIAICTAIPAMAVAAVGYLAVFVPRLAQDPMLGAASALAIIWLLTSINLAGVRSAGIFQLVTTLLKLLPLFLITGSGLLLGDAGAVPAQNPGNQSWPALISTLALLTMWPFLGFEVATIPADDTIAPKKNIPRALLAGTLTVTLVYLLATYGLMALIPPSRLAGSSSPFADAASLLFGPWGADLVALGALISITGALNATILVAGVMPRAIALEGLFPARFARLNQHQAPAYALLISAMVGSVLIVMNHTQGLVAVYRMLIVLSTLTTLLPYAASAVAELVLQRQDAAKGRRHWGAAAIATAALAFSVVAIVGAGWKDDLYGLLLLAAGLPLYWRGKHVQVPS